MSFPIRSLVSGLCKLTLNLPSNFQLSSIWPLILSIYIPEIPRLIRFGQLGPYQDFYVHRRCQYNRNVMVFQSNHATNSIIKYILFSLL